jgi:outer membrane protein assembly factor BamB
VVFASDFANGELMAVDALTGKLLWKRTVSERYPSAPAVAGDAVYVGYLNSVQAFSARTGQQLWNYPAQGLITKLAASGGTLYAAVDAAGPGSVLYALRV